MKKTNEKGFTLIELLAVIVILAILMITAIPAVTNSIAKSTAFTANNKIFPIPPSHLFTTAVIHYTYMEAYRDTEHT